MTSSLPGKTARKWRFGATPWPTLRLGGFCGPDGTTGEALDLRA
jgi:hypothetical protein